MNLFKKLGIFACLGFSVLALGSCARGIGTLTTNQAIDNQNATDSASDDFDYAAATMTSISIVESTAKTKFYLGDEFSSEGLTAKATFVSYAGGSAVSKSFETQDLTVDSSNVDFYNVGTYPVKVTYRYMRTVRSTTYNVQVISSEFDAAGVEYVGGIEVTYFNKKSYDYALDTSGKTQMTLNQFRVKLHYYKSGVELEDKAAFASKTLYGTDASAKIFIDYSTVNFAVRGTYIAKVTYTADPVTINGKSVSYKVNSFVIINVNDDVTTFSFYSGTTSFVADVNDIDYSDWKFKVTRKISGVEIVDYSPEMFTISGISPFVEGEQTAVVVCAELANMAKSVKVTITESEKYTITTGNIYDVTIDASGNPVYGGEVFKAKDDMGGRYGETPANFEGTFELDSSGMFSITNADNYEDRSKPDNFGSLYFGTRIRIKGANSYISITVSGPAKIVVYAAATGDNSSRDIGIYDVEGNLIRDAEGNELQEFTNESYLKGKVEQFIFEVDEAGTYLVKSMLQTWVYGFVIAVEK